MCNRKRNLFVILFLLLLNAGCRRASQNNVQASIDTANKDVSFIDVLIHDTYYEDEDNNLAKPPIWQVKSGTHVVARLVNNGSLKHNWAIVKPDAKISLPYRGGGESKQLLYQASMLYKNNQTTVTFTAPDPGDYLVICTVVDHYPYMQGVLRVEE